MYATFNGRARRSEYWFFTLFNAIVAFILGLIFPPISFIYPIFILLPSLAVLVRRLHDIGKSGWWIFICLIPLIGSIWLLVLLCTDSNAETNNYGENPKVEPATIS